MPRLSLKKKLNGWLKKFPSLKSEYSDIIDLLLENPKTGIPIGHDCYKIRISIESKGKGKSGGARIITYIYVQGSILFLIAIYDKSERADITDAELLKLLNKIE